MSHCAIPRLAVLIDADSTPPKALATIFAEISRYGRADTRRAYGDAAMCQSESWTDAFTRHAISPLAMLPFERCKNAADIALVIDGMDLLHTGRFDGFCIVATDSDFARLAMRIRDQGLDVFGFGMRNTPEIFRHACRRFTYIENLHSSAPANDPNSTVKSLFPLADAAPILKTMISGMAGPDGWVPVEELEAELERRVVDFDSRSHGFRRLSDLLRKMKGVVLDRPRNQPARVRLKARKRKGQKGRQEATSETPKD